MRSTSDCSGTETAQSKPFNKIPVMLAIRFASLAHLCLYTMADLCVRLGRRIASLRSKKGLSQDVLAGLSAISRVNLSRIENGRAEAGIRTLHRIAAALGITLHDLLSGLD